MRKIQDAYSINHYEPKMIWFIKSTSIVETIIWWKRNETAYLQIEDITRTSFRIENVFNLLYTVYKNAKTKTIIVSHDGWNSTDKLDVREHIFESKVMRKIQDNYSINDYEATHLLSRR